MADRRYGDRGIIGRALIRAYQRWVPVNLKGNCRNVPHCSEYGLMVVEINGTLRGGVMALRRIFACGSIATAMGVPGVDDCGGGFLRLKDRHI
jgi:putative component of membrane protein insertase Oxa1/YidC/SpoIIIJ protein YidD